MTHEPTAYDRSLAEALGGGDGTGDLRERLLSGAPTDEDRSEARAHLDKATRRRFELAHPLPPRQQDLELEAETIELSPGDLSNDKSWKQHATAIRDELRKAADDSGEAKSIVVTLRVRLTTEG